MERPKPQKSQYKTEGKNKVRELMLSDYKTYYKSTLIETILFWRNRWPIIDQGIEQRTEIQPHKSINWDLIKKQKQVNRERTVFQKRGLEQTHMQKKKKKSRHRPYTFYKNWPPINHRLKFKTQNYKRRQHRRKILVILGLVMSF